PLQQFENQLRTYVKGEAAPEAVKAEAAGLQRKMYRRLPGDSPSQSYIGLHPVQEGRRIVQLHSVVNRLEAWDPLTTDLAGLSAICLHGIGECSEIEQKAIQSLAKQATEVTFNDLIQAAFRLAGQEQHDAVEFLFFTFKQKGAYLA